MRGDSTPQKIRDHIGTDLFPGGLAIDHDTLIGLELSAD